MADEAAAYPEPRQRRRDLPDAARSGPCRSWTDPTALSMLRRLGIPVVQCSSVGPARRTYPTACAADGRAAGHGTTRPRPDLPVRDDLAASATLPAGSARGGLRCQRLYRRCGRPGGRDPDARGLSTTSPPRLHPTPAARSPLELLVMAAPDLIITSAALSRRVPGRGNPAITPPLQALVAAGSGLAMPDRTGPAARPACSPPCARWSETDSDGGARHDPRPVPRSRSADRGACSRCPS